ncbi:MAG TPA: hypothetical protein VGO39_14555 [Gaiellaceae bacterium]|jgi:hypothetical protein|nr:hypothetical protein [Gaiellaceae bacterium]
MTVEELSADFRESAAKECEALAARVLELRAEAEMLRARADEVESHASEYERLSRELAGIIGTAPQLKIELDDDVLRGRQIRDVAVRVLADEVGFGQPVHYTDWFEMLGRRGLRISGKDPLAAFLAQIIRSPRVERIGQRSGRYQLTSS